MSTHLIYTQSLISSSSSSLANQFLSLARQFAMASTYLDADPEDMQPQLLRGASSGNLRLLKHAAESLDKGNGLAEMVKGVKCPKGLSALHHAAEGGRTEICRYIVEELGIPVDLRASFPPNSPIGELVGGTPLLYAAKEGRCATVRYLIEHGADPTATDKISSTALHYAAEFGHAEVVEYLLSKGAPVDPENYRGTPLHQAASHGEESVIKILLKHGADINKLMNGLVTPLLNSIMAGSLQCTKLLIKAGADVNLRCPLVATIYKNEVEMMKCLLDAGADPNIPNEDEELPIEIAVMGGKNEMIEILFPLTSPIPQVQCWSIRGLSIHLDSLAFHKRSKEVFQKKLVNFRTKGADAFRSNDFLTAVFFYNAAIGIDSKDGTLFANRSLCFLKAGFGECALKDACLARSLKPDWPKAYYRIGAALMLLEDYEEASRVFMYGLKLDRTNEEMKKALRDALDCMKKSLK